MKRIRIGYVNAVVPDDVYDWPANVDEIEQKVAELNEIINSMATGETIRWLTRSSGKRHVFF